MAKRVDETKAGKQISAYVIMKGSKLIGKVQAHFSDGGTCTVNAWDFSPKDETRYMSGKASGYGYDKFTAAISGMVFDGHELVNHCGAKAKTPKRGYWLREDKLARGFNLANGCYFHAPSGKRVTCYNEYDYQADGDSTFKRHVYVIPKGEQSPGYWSANENEVKANPDMFEEVDPETVVYGYHDAHKQSGLDYLRALGYQVIQAI